MMHGLYNALLAFGDTASQPGAELDAAWYLRNARIFAEPDRYLVDAKK
jgi:hypothetical protein